MPVIPSFGMVLWSDDRAYPRNPSMQNPIRTAARYVRPLIVALAAFGALTVNAQVFSEDFGALADGTTVDNSTTGFNGTALLFSPSRLAITTDGNAGDGSSLLMQGSSSNSNTGLAAISKKGLTMIGIGTLSFSLYTPATRGTHGLFFYAAMGNGSQSYYSPSTAAFSSFGLYVGLRLNFDTGKLETYYSNTWHDLGVNALDPSTLYQFSIVFNGELDPVNYGGTTVAGGKADLWLNGSLVADDFDINRVDGVSAIVFKSLGKSGDDPIVELDNIALYNSAIAPTPVPEPATYAALAGVLALGFVAYRRRQAA